MNITLKPLDMVYVFIYMTLNSKAIKLNMTVTTTIQFGLNLKVLNWPAYCKGYHGFSLHVSFGLDVYA